MTTGYLGQGMNFHECAEKSRPTADLDSTSFHVYPSGAVGFDRSGKLLPIASLMPSRIAALSTEYVSQIVNAEPINPIATKNNPALAISSISFPSLFESCYFDLSKTAAQFRESVADHAERVAMGGPACGGYQREVHPVGNTGITFQPLPISLGAKASA